MANHRPYLRALDTRVSLRQVFHLHRTYGGYWRHLTGNDFALSFAGQLFHHFPGTVISEPGRGTASGAASRA